MFRSAFGRKKSPRFAESEMPDAFLEASTIEEEQVRLLGEVEGDLSTIATLADDGPENDDARYLLPWWKRPSPVWILVLVPFTAIATASTYAPRVEVYTMLVCKVLRPDYIVGAVLPGSMSVAGAGRAQCAADPVVQQSVAALQTVLAACQGILSCLTAGAWGLYSDRKGRTRVLGISVWGILINDFIFILVVFCANSLPGNYWVLVIGPLIEGLLGGTPGSIAAIHAYVADTTDPATRSSAFSLALGLIFVGVALGPTIGGLMVRFTHQAISVFYMTTVIHLIYALVMWFIIPESLSKFSMRRSLKKYNEIKLDTTEGPLYYAKRAVSFLSPLTVFAPKRISDSRSKNARSSWSLLLMATAYGFSQTLMGSYPFKFQYAAATFGWTSEKQGYWLSLVSATRALYLTLLLPFVIKFCKSVIVRRTEDKSNSRSRSPQRKKAFAAFDLKLARLSLLIEVVCYCLLGIFAHPIAFVAFSTMSSLGSGFSPAIQALALDLYTQQGGTESGELFGALSVVSALASQVFGPFIFGFVYINTVATFSRAIFVICFAIMATAFILVSLVRLRSDTHSDNEEPLTHSEEDNLLN